MTEEKYDEGLERIAKHYGAEHQIVKAAEEFSEAATAAIRYSAALREDDRIDRYMNLIEELADAEVMIAQLKILFPNLETAMAHVRTAKVTRQLERIKKEEDEG